MARSVASAEGEPTLAQAWQMLGGELGLAVEERGERSVRAVGTVRGRAVEVDIEGTTTGGGFLMQFRPVQRQRKARQRWHTSLTVGCVNPRGLTGRLRSFVDIQHPDWDPRNFDPTHCRVVDAEPHELAAVVLTDDVRARLASVWGDVEIAVAADHVGVRAEAGTSMEGGFVAGSVIHHPPSGPTLPWPERALAGPRWWVHLLCDVADSLDR